MKGQQKMKIQQFHPDIEDGTDLRRWPLLSANKSLRMLKSDMITLITWHLFPQKQTYIIQFRSCCSFIHTVNCLISGKNYSAEKNLTLPLPVTGGTNLISGTQQG